VESVEVLELLKTKGCPWDINVFKAAAGTGNKKVIRWLKEAGCPYSEEAFAYIMRNEAPN
jgi:hypothetical protein